ncbi:hypothetical protein [Aeribacillus sp. FSL M8-0254]|uniref:hypothetical protein n=1 Tax=Aeribacillus sp. FSL M8-0254 TaxID=2954577 RepID=UPI0030F66B1F
MRRVIDKVLDWSRSQTIMKRPPKTDARLVYYIACESWLERLLESDLHAKFTSPHAVEDFAWRVLSQSGWGVPVAGYDTAWVELITTFKPRLREWWAQSHEQDNRTVERIAVLMALEQFDLKDEWVAEKVNELRTELINGMEVMTDRH